ncbi:MAG: DUF829 domain-containing protein [Sandaracinaceae bacterium]|nr:DUF829 domain-containing protein [Sandaracinaceae bacterium]
MAGDEPQLDLTGVHVAILGWAGSRPRQLRGVGGFYRRAGAEVITASADVFRAMARPQGWAEEGRALADRLVEADPGDLVIHSFSNAGFWTYAATLRALPHELRSRVRGVILDSAPGFPERIDPWFYARYSTMAMMPMVLHAFRRPPALSHPLLTPPLWAFLRLWYHVSPTQIASAEQSIGVVCDTGSWDHLLLYSTADRLVPSDLVDAFVERLRRADRAVETERWDDSAHVRHMIVRRHEYFARVAAFLAARLPGSADRSAA